MRLPHQRGRLSGLLLALGAMTFAGSALFSPVFGEEREGRGREGREREGRGREDNKNGWQPITARELPRAVRDAAFRQQALVVGAERGRVEGRRQYRLTFNGRDGKTFQVTFAENGRVLSRGDGKPADAVVNRPNPNPGPVQPPAKIDLKNVTYSKTIQPLLATNCYRCHSGARAKSGVDLQSSFARLSETVTPGKPEDSLLYQSLTGKGAKLMPPKRHLADAEVQAVKAWIAAGAKQN